MFQKSIRFKIILWYMLVLALTLLFFSLLLYQNYSRSLYKNLDQLLNSKAGGVVNSIDTYWEAEKLGALELSQTFIRPGVFSKINNINFAKIATHCIEERSGDPALMNIMVRIFDAKGKLIVSSKNTANVGLLPVEALQDVLNGNSRFDNATVDLSGGKPLPLRVYTTPVIEDGRVAYIVQIASSLVLLYAALNRLQVILFLLLPLTVFLTGMVGAFLAKVTLNPVEEMIRTIRQIKADNLKLRISIPDTKDEIRRLADTFNDILGELDRAFSMQQQFIQDVSHDLRTPLTILKGEIEVALKKARSPKEYESVLSSSLEEINKINKVIENLLILARFDSKKLPLEIKEVDLNTKMQNVVKDMEVLAEQKNIHMNIFEEEKITLEGDENQLRQLFSNLLDNAIKYTDAGGKVSVNLSRQNGFAKIQVSDTGIGIPDKELPFIFDRFYRVDKARGGCGFGLGLSIAKTIAEVHGGTIEVESEPDRGAVFTVFLSLSR